MIQLWQELIRLLPQGCRWIACGDWNMVEELPQHVVEFYQVGRSWNLSSKKLIYKSQAPSCIMGLLFIHGTTNSIRIVELWPDLIEFTLSLA
jgi:hypothetical protein